MSIYVLDTGITYGGFRVIVTDQNSASDFDMDQLRTVGPVIEAEVEKIVLYKSIIQEFKNLEDDLQFECRHYDKDFSYHQV